MTAQSLLVNVLFGSVTGNAEEIARRIHADLPSHGLTQGHICSLADHATVPAFTKPDARASVYNVIVVSTTGDGDPPDTIRPFMKLMRCKDRTRLTGLQFAVLGLGDTNYENFCKTGKRVDSSLPKIGAERFLARGDADDGVGLELVVEPWIDSLWEKFAELSPQSTTSESTSSPPSNNDTPIPKADSTTILTDVIRSVTAAELGVDEATLPPLVTPKLSVISPVPALAALPPSLHPAYDTETARVATVADARLLTAADAANTVWHVELSATLPVHHPGAAFGLLVQNAMDDVTRALARLEGPSAETIVSLRDDQGRELAVASVRELLQQRPDLRASPSKTMLRALSMRCSVRDEAKRLLHLCSRAGRSEYSERISRIGRGVFDVLDEEAPSCRPTLVDLLDLLPALSPRWYSAASASAVDERVHFAFSVVPNGLATSMLAKQCEALLAGEKVSPVVLLPRVSDSESMFKPPAVHVPYIMIGPGTGVAPFRGFLRERAAAMQNSPEVSFGRTMLFFGCRHADKDFLYEKEMRELEKDGVVDVLDVAFSRDGPEKVYVQDRMLARAEEVAGVIEDGGMVFVCGDGGGMARGVHDALTEILTEKCCDGDSDGGKAKMKMLTKEKRYVRDIWFHGELHANAEL